MAEGIIDRATFAELQASAGEDFVKELVDTFLEEAPVMFDELRAAFATGDADAFRRAAHSLKSNSQTFGALRLGAMARTLELEGLPPDAAPVDALAQAYAAAKTALAALRDE
jgi:HPt (histidine-containing phosphotransfer) domain-containing protein